MLSAHDVRRLSDALKAMHGQATLDGLVGTARLAIEDLIGCDWVSVSLASPRFTRPSRFWSPYSAMQERTTEAFAAFYHQHPSWRSFWTSLRPGATQLLGLATTRELTTLPIYHEVLRPLRIANLLAVPMPDASMFAVGVIRDRPRLFTSRDSAVVEVIADHLAAAARRLPAPSAPPPARGADADVRGRVAFVAVDRAGRVARRSPGAAAILRRFFRTSAREALPRAVAAWLADRTPSPVLTVATEHSALDVCRFDPRVGPGYCLVLHEQEIARGFTVPPELTPREATVLRWVVGGKTNREIGVILDISHRTVQKHLENVFGKVGVPTRTALVAQVLDRSGT
jgi:DNA-binding CsgD family transcriptional regulator